MILYAFAILGASILWIGLNGVLFVWRLGGRKGIINEGIPPLGVAPDEACFCGKKFMPDDLPYQASSRGWPAAIELLIAVGICVPLFIPQELLRRWLHQKRCLAWQIRSMDKKV